MPTVTRLVPQQRNPRRLNIHLDGRFAFVCTTNVAAKFALSEGAVLSDEQLAAIQRGHIRQMCLDDALRILERRLHSRAELERKLSRKKHAPELIQTVLEELRRLGYVDDRRFSQTKASSAAEHRKHGRGRAYRDLLKAGVEGETARRAVEDVYEQTDSLAIARELALKKAPYLRRLDPLVARRRLAGMLLRRGFDYEAIRPVLDEVLGPEPE
ncbi:MAG: regulatory protein RecX [Tepidisphaerales bacterium]